MKYYNCLAVIFNTFFPSFLYFMIVCTCLFLFFLTLGLMMFVSQTREELRDALETEIRSFSNDRDLAGSTLIAWNHQEFEVQYQCLQDEVRIGDYYLRLLLERKDEDSPIRRS